MMRAMPHLPLDGMRVLDVTTSIAGPYCAQILAALGADVVKVERPDTGDDARAWGPPFWDGEGTMFLSANAGKRSLALSLSDARGREALLRLADEADVFLQSLRPGLADELGLGPDVLRERNPRLVYCSLGAYGHTGPLAREPGYDALMQAAGGLISMTGEPGPSGRPGRLLADRPGNGHLGSARRARRAPRARAHGRGLRRRRLPLRDGDRLHRLPPRRLPRRRHHPGGRGHALPDGGAVPGVRHPRRRAAGRGRERSAVPLDLRGARPAGARRRRRGLPPTPTACETATRSRRSSKSGSATDDTTAWQARLTTRRRPGRARSPTRATSRVSPQTEALGILQRLEHPRIADLTLAALPLSFDRERALHRSAPPDVGEHSAEVLREAGYTRRGDRRARRGGCDEALTLGNVGGAGGRGRRPALPAGRPAAIGDAHTAEGGGSWGNHGVPPRRYS